tara:strand:+ start:495 stop:1601 length:1107 start_codon:yes stop_codon:yes gene_type:complete
MEINYKIEKKLHKITFCHNRESPDINKALSKLYSDKKMLVIIDKRVNKNCTKYLFKDLKKSGVKLEILKVDGNKINKNKNFLLKIIDKLIEKKFSKKSVILSCGGGVIGDVSALAASLYLRGMIYFHIPTTMTAIVDSCIGGKTGINYKKIINSIGNYYHAQNVFISKNIINFIPKREYIAGIPEIIKCGLIHNKKILNIVLKNKNKILKKDYSILLKIISLTLKTKIIFFKDDVNENNKRLALNFGHTFAHAIEMSLLFNRDEIIRHGEAVGIGMLAEIFYSEGKNKKFKILNDLLEIYNLPTSLKKYKYLQNFKNLKNIIFKNIFLDKKRINKYPRCIKINNHKPSIIEMRNNSKIKKTIEQIIVR